MVCFQLCVVWHILGKKKFFFLVFPVWWGWTGLHGALTLTQSNTFVMNLNLQTAEPRLILPNTSVGQQSHIDEMLTPIYLYRNTGFVFIIYLLYEIWCWASHCYFIVINMLITAVSTYFRPCSTIRTVKDKLTFPGAHSVPSRGGPFLVLQK